MTIWRRQIQMDSTGSASFAAVVSVAKVNYHDLNEKQERTGPIVATEGARPPGRKDGGCPEARDAPWAAQSRQGSLFPDRRVCARPLGHAVQVRDTDLVGLLSRRASSCVRLAYIIRPVTVNEITRGGRIRLSQRFAA